MAAISHRQSGVAGPSRREMPEYQTTTYPLTDSAKASLSALLASHSLTTLERTLEKANHILAEDVAELNDHYHLRAEPLAARKERLSRMSDPSEEEQAALDAQERELNGWKTRVDTLTARMDEMVQRNIDAQAIVDDVVSSITELVNTSSSQPPSTITPTDPSSSTQPSQSFLPRFTASLTSKRDRYTSHTPAQRYTSNNSYRQFRKLLHDAQHPDLPVPHESTWFPAPTSAAPGQTALPANAEDDDDDIIATRATVSTKCPLTLLEFVSPVTSAKCPHSFEADAIHSLISASRTRVDAAGQVVESHPRRGQPTPTTFPAVRCPVPGCERVLAATDLAPDPVLLRRIARLQRAAQTQAELDEEHGTRGKRRRTVMVGSSDVEESDGEDMALLKRERMTQTQQTQRGRSEEL